MRQSCIQKTFRFDENKVKRDHMAIYLVLMIENDKINWFCHRKNIGVGIVSSIRDFLIGV